MIIGEPEIIDEQHTVDAQPLTHGHEDSLCIAVECAEVDGERTVRPPSKRAQAPNETRFSS